MMCNMLILHSIKRYLIYIIIVFHIKKIDKPYYNKIPWLTLALKESIKTKNNKLYVASTKDSNKEEKSTQYKIYRNKFHHVLRSTERNYYHDLLVEHKSISQKVLENNEICYKQAQV